MSAPIQRRHLGDFIVNDKYERGVTHKIAVYVNAEMVAKRFGSKAAGNKSKRSLLGLGAILVEAI